MIEQIFPGLYRIDIPLPNNPLKTLNSYFIRGTDRNLLIDTGFNAVESNTAMVQALEELGVSMENTDLFITHFHSDHCGLVKSLAAPNTTVWMGEAGIELMEADHKENLFEIATSNFIYFSGLQAEGTPNMPQEAAEIKYAGKGFTRFTPVYDGEWFNIGGYNFICYETPGHCHGHMCLYEPDRKILIAGDHILVKITPNISLWQLDHNPLEDYFHSIDRIAALDINLVLPGHRSLINNHRNRINEIKRHHEHRLQEVMDIIGGHKMSAAQIAIKMKWDMSYSSWNEFPLNTKIHAATEAMSHIYYLVKKGLLTMENERGIYFFSRV